MQKRAPTLGNLLVIILFTLSCFGLLLFLWESFGGPLPLKPKGYRFTVAFPRTLALTEQSDVRISGVEVGHVVAVNLGKEGYTRRNDRTRRAVLADPRQHARDPAPEDASGRDLRAADPRGPHGPVPGRRGQTRRQQRRTVRDARRHPVAAEPHHAAELPGVDALPGRRDRRARGTDQRVAVHLPAIRRTWKHAARNPRRPGRGRESAGQATRGSCSTPWPGATTSSKG
jgi:hypothetical protein